MWTKEQQKEYYYSEEQIARRQTKQYKKQRSKVSKVYRNQPGVKEHIEKMKALRNQAKMLTSLIAGGGDVEALKVKLAEVQAAHKAESESFADFRASSKGSKVVVVPANMNVAELRKKYMALKSAMNEFEKLIMTYPEK